MREKGNELMLRTILRLFQSRTDPVLLYPKEENKEYHQLAGPVPYLMVAGLSVLMSSAANTVFYSWTRDFILTLPLSTQVYKWLPANLMLGVTLRGLACHPGGRRNTPSRFTLQKPYTSSGLMGIQSFRTHGRFVPRRFVPTFGRFVPNPLIDSYPKNFLHEMF